MANLQPKDKTSAGSSLNPPVYKTFVPKELLPENNSTKVEFKKFFDFEKFNTGIATPENGYDSNPIRTLDFVRQNIMGSLF